MFLKKERNLILKHYPKLESQKAYYKYHYENYFIRIVIISDILGKLGSLIYGFKENNAYTFKKTAKKEGYEKISLIMDKVIEKIKKIKAERNEKLHEGTSDVTFLGKTIIWEDITKITSIEIDSILKVRTDEEIKTKIEDSKNNLIEIIEIIKEFLDESTKKLDKILK